ncbi:MAG: DUF2905 domain-containing protein [Bacillota bacterium]|nr:DUF2905 domain-containing protein [Bacillota bacterium]
MEGLTSLGKFLLVLGLFLAGVGLLLLALGHVPGLGRLPGDIYVKKGNFVFYFPLATGLVLSLLLTLLLNLFARR